LIAAAGSFDLIELEGELDLVPEVLNRIGPAQRLLSWRGSASGLEELHARFEALCRVEARLYALTPFVTRAIDALAPLQLLKALGRKDVLAYAVGEAGSWTRVLSPWVGAPVVLGGLVADKAREGQFTVEQLLRDYSLGQARTVRELFGIVGRGVLRSPSPRMHNMAYQALGLEALYLPFYAEDFSHFWSDTLLHGLEALGFPLRGLTVTSPHKEAALEIAGSASPLARCSGAANALVRREEGWYAETTDAVGAVAPLGTRGLCLKGLRVAVVGCGGAGRAAAAGLQQAGALVTLVNRGWERGQYAARLLGLPFIPLSEFSASSFALVVNATPCATSREDAPFLIERLTKGTVILDFVYGSRPTPLVPSAQSQEHLAIDGQEVLLVEVHRQFQLMTGRQMPSAPVTPLT
jgi:3-dehydroquinate dehydratase/shikimate dehydrogenase